MQQPGGDQTRHAGTDHDHALGLARPHGPGTSPRAGHRKTNAGNAFMSSNGWPPAAAKAARLA